MGSSGGGGAAGGGCDRCTRGRGRGGERGGPCSASDETGGAVGSGSGMGMADKSGAGASLSDGGLCPALFSGGTSNVVHAVGAMRIAGCAAVVLVVEEAQMTAKVTPTTAAAASKARAHRGFCERERGATVWVET